MQIENMTMVDYNDVYQLWNRTKGIGLNSVDDSREGVSRFLLRNPTSCFVAREDMRMVAVVLAGHDGRRGYLYHVAVDEGVRGTGLGKALVDKAIEALRNEGIIKVGLVAFRNNEIGNRFWENLGFEERPDLVYRSKSITDQDVVVTIV